jgi:AraC-like DNA-binding protein
MGQSVQAASPNEAIGRWADVVPAVDISSAIPISTRGPGRLMDDAEPVALTVPIRPLGPLTIARLTIAGDLPPDSELTGVLFLPDDRRLTLHDGTVLDVRAGDLVALPVGGLLRGAGPQPLVCTALLASWRFLGTVLPSRSTAMVMPGSVSIEAIRRHVERLAVLPVGLTDKVQALAAARSVRELLAAAAVPGAATPPRGAQREAALLDRIVDHVAMMLAGEVNVGSLCEALGCSRSALYRAAAPMGGLIELVTHQRLVAIYHALGCGNDRRPIAEIARAYGFADASRFSRRFRRAFGLSAGRVRAAAGMADGVLCHPDTARLFALTGRGGAGAVGTT